MARNLFQLHQGNLISALGESRNGQRLLSRPELADDVAFCARLDTHGLVVALGKEGLVVGRNA
jgi:phosphosulfolactate phosphohydrolase-like enzyme